MKLINYDLEGDAPTVPAPSVGEQWVLVRFHKHPIGLLTLEPGRPHSAEDVRRLAVDRFSWNVVRHLMEDAFQVGKPYVPGEPVPFTCPRHADVELPTLTAAVCTRNGAGRLAECLDSLLALDYPPALLDLVVVDNAPADDSTERLVATYPRLRYVKEPRPGLDWARNRALLEARGEIVAFTDDDVSVDPWWAQAIARVFIDEPAVMAVTGLVVADEIDADSQRLFEKYGGFSRGFSRRDYKVNFSAGERAATRHGGAGRFGTGANMAFRRRLFDEIGYFDPALDVGTLTNGGGDLEMFFRVLKEGHSLVYEPAAMVRHRHRREYGQLKTQLANNGIGFYAYLVRSASAYRDERAEFLKLGVWWFWWWNVRRLLKSFIRPSAFPRDLILAELRGCFTGLRRYRRAQSRAEEIARLFGPQQPTARGGAAS